MIIFFSDFGMPFHAMIVFSLGYDFEIHSKTLKLHTQYLENFEHPKMYKIWVNPSLKRSVKEHNNDMALILMMCDISLCRIVWTVRAGGTKGAKGAIAPPIFCKPYEQKNFLNMSPMFSTIFRGSWEIFHVSFRSFSG